MPLSPEEMVLYRNLKVIFQEPIVHDTLVKYSRMQYNIALNNLVKAQDIREVGKWQQAVMIYEHLINIKANVDTVIKNATQQSR